MKTDVNNCISTQRKTGIFPFVAQAQASVGLLEPNGAQYFS